MKFFLYLSLSLSMVGCSHARVRAPLEANPDYGQVQNANPVQGPRVILVPQWHLAPQTNTTYSSSESLPQAENQQAIYRQLVDWVEAQQVQSVVVEGCEGEINHSFTTRFNGWGIEDLEKLTAEQLDHVVTNVGLKIKAKVGEKARVICGDSLELIKKHQLILSDMRGLLGFKVRMTQFKNDEKKRVDYVTTVRDLLKLPHETSEADVMSKLDEQLRAKLSEFNDVLHQRDASFVRAAKFAAPTAAVVIGAIHIKDLDAQFKSQNVATSTFEPRGLKGDEAVLLDQIQALLAVKPAATLEK